MAARRRRERKFVSNSPTEAGQRMLAFIAARGVVTHAELCAEFGNRATPGIVNALLWVGRVTRPIRGTSDPFIPVVTPHDRGRAYDVDCSRWMLAAASTAKDIV